MVVMKDGECTVTVFPTHEPNGRLTAQVYPMVQAPTPRVSPGPIRMGREELNWVQHPNSSDPRSNPFWLHT